MDKIVLFSLLVAFILNIVAYRVINSRDNVHPPLKDVLHDKLPLLDQYYMNDILTVSIFVFAVFNLSLQQLNKFTIILVILYVLRAFTMCATHIPAVNPRCKSAIFDSCHDLMFSGHTTMTVVSLLALHYWQNLSLFISIPYYLVTIFFILAQRRHYTTDVIVASVLSFSVFHNLK